MYLKIGVAISNHIIFKILINLTTIYVLFGSDIRLYIFWKLFFFLITQLNIFFFI